MIFASQRDFSSGKFNVTLECFYSQPTGTLVDSMWYDSYVRATVSGVWENPDVIPLKCAHSCGDLDLHSFGPPETTSQMASRSVQPFCRAHTHSHYIQTDYSTYSNRSLL